MKKILLSKSKLFIHNLLVTKMLMGFGIFTFGELHSCTFCSYSLVIGDQNGSRNIEKIILDATCKFDFKEELE